jgi:hypothetical protein
MYKNKLPVLRKLNLKTMYSQPQEVPAHVHSFMVEEVKQRYTSSEDLNEVKSKLIRIE